ncbi:unnamed protein product [Ectocarpus sp. 13 AM-2016]
MAGPLGDPQLMIRGHSSVGFSRVGFVYTAVYGRSCWPSRPLGHRLLCISSLKSTSSQQQVRHGVSSAHTFMFYNSRETEEMTHKSQKMKKLTAVDRTCQSQTNSKMRADFGSITAAAVCCCCARFISPQASKNSHQCPSCLVFWNGLLRCLVCLLTFRIISAVTCVLCGQ